MSNRATTPGINRTRSGADAMHDPALAEFGKRRRTDWVGIFTLVLGLLLVAVCLYSAFTDPQNTSDAGAPPQPITSRSRNANP